MEFTKPTDQPTANVLLYGKPKSGKTIGACTAPGEILLINADLANASRQAHLRHGERIKEVKLPAFERDKRTQLIELIAEVSRIVKAPDCPYQTVVLDPVGELYRRLIEEHSNRVVRPSLPQYGDVGAQVERFCRFLCEIPTINVVLVAHEQPLKTDSSEEIEKIAFTGTKSGSETLSGKLMSMVDIIGYTAVLEREDGKKEWVAQLVPGKGRTGGDRFDCLAREADYRSINIAEWLRIIEAEEQKVRTSAQVETEKRATKETVKA